MEGYFTVVPITPIASLFLGINRAGNHVHNAEALWLLKIAKEKNTKFVQTKSVAIKQSSFLEVMLW